jgi:glycine dehydrogenase subunit 1
MDVSNASLYDGATSLAEAVLMSLRINKRKKILVAENIHPEYREVLKTYLKGFDFKIEEIPFTTSGMLDINKLKVSLDEETSCCALQTPNFFGLIEDTQNVTKAMKAKGALSIVVTNPHSLSLLREPARLGADIVCGDGQPLGSPLNLGGPAFGFLTTKNEFMRQLPGRIVGTTKDREGNQGFCLTLQAREQHIRREKATSNICSNQSLNAIGAALYLSLLGKEGFKRAGTYSLNLSHYCYQSLAALPGVSLPFAGPFFNEFIWQVPNAEHLWQTLYKENIICGILVEKFYPQLKNCILMCCTEKKTKQEIDDFIHTVKKLTK